jgi:hypothetical protein
VIPLDCDHLFLVLAYSQFGLHVLCLFNFYLFLVIAFVIETFLQQTSAGSFLTFSKCRLFVDHYE